MGTGASGEAMSSHLVGTFVTDFPWFHRWMGLVGNGLFVIGSVFFLYERLTVVGTWIFVAASFGMFVDSVGEKLVRREEELRRDRSPAAASSAEATSG